MKERRSKVSSEQTHLSKRRRAFLLGVNLSSCYIKPKMPCEDLVTVLNEIRDIYALRPFQGYRRITLDLKDKGYIINHKKVYRLMKLIDMQAVYPKKNLSRRNHAHKVYPYLLKDFPPVKPHDAWCIDITYVRMVQGFIYLTALIDVVSRYIVGWSISTCLDTESCLQALEMAIRHGYLPQIINSDQGCQFTSQEWIYQLTLLGVKISMDGKGRAIDNIPIERFWRTVKYEEVYLKTYETVEEAKKSLADYIDWYNHKRRHSAIGYCRPFEILTGIYQPEKPQFAKVDGYVDNANALTHIPTTTTTTTNINKNKVEMMTMLSSNIQL